LNDFARRKEMIAKKRIAAGLYWNRITGVRRDDRRKSPRERDFAIADTGNLSRHDITVQFDSGEP
jgi:hypothetical protein